MTTIFYVCAILYIHMYSHCILNTKQTKKYDMINSHHQTFHINIPPRTDTIFSSSYFSFLFAVRKFFRRKSKNFFGVGSQEFFFFFFFGGQIFSPDSVKIGNSHCKHIIINILMLRFQIKYRVLSNMPLL